MITFDKGSVIRLSNEGIIGIVLGIAESQLPKSDNLAGYASCDAYFSENFCVTILVLLKEDFLYGDEDDYMNSLTQRYVDIILQNVSISKLSYCIELSLKKLLQSQLVLDKKVDITPYLKDIKPETLLVFGDKDDSTPLYMGKIMEEKMPDAALVVFEGDDHFAYFHQGDRFNLVLEAFLKKYYA